MPVGSDSESLGKLRIALKCLQRSMCTFRYSDPARSIRHSRTICNTTRSQASVATVAPLFAGQYAYSSEVHIIHESSGVMLVRVPM